MAMLIRKAKIEDAKTLILAQREIAEEPGYFCSDPSELTEESVCNTIKSPNGIFLVAEKDGVLVGHAFLEIFELKSLRHVAQLNIVVHKGYQEKGYGTLLMERIIEWAKQTKTIEKIELNVRLSNTRAIALYKKMGFIEEGCLKNRVKVGDRYFDDLIMALYIR